MRNKNLLVLIIVILAVAVVAALAIFMPKSTPDLSTLPTAAPTAAPTEAANGESAEAGDAADETAEGTQSVEDIFTAPGYLYVTAGSEGRWFELPSEGSDPVSFTVRMTGQDGVETENKITMTPDSVYMAHSTCDNQDCVQQGVVSLDNKDDRVLLNLIVCLPNQVSLELFDNAEMRQMVAEAEAAAAAESTETPAQ